MQQLRWTNNICTVDWTCLHGSFTVEELDQMFLLCPSGSCTPTFYHEKLGGGFSSTKRIKEVGLTGEQSYYFSFPLSQIKPLFVWLALTYPQTMPLKLEEGVNSSTIRKLLETTNYVLPR
jgi:hypothetical protein